jgi:hypothetical protein
MDTMLRVSTKGDYGVRWDFIVEFGRERVGKIGGVEIVGGD